MVLVNRITSYKVGVGVIEKSTTRFNFIEMDLDAFICMHASSPYYIMFVEMHHNSLL
jgi:hypothetical protein